MKRSPLTGKKAVVRLERNGACVEIHDVEARQAVSVLAELLEAYRALSAEFDELVVELPSVPGGSPVDADASEFGARKRAGFVR